MVEHEHIKDHSVPQTFWVKITTPWSITGHCIIGDNFFNRYPTFTAFAPFERKLIFHISHLTLTLLYSQHSKHFLLPRPCEGVLPVTCCDVILCNKTQQIILDSCLHTMFIYNKFVFLICSFFTCMFVFLYAFYAASCVLNNNNTKQTRKQTALYYFNGCAFRWLDSDTTWRDHT